MSQSSETDTDTIHLLVIAIGKTLVRQQIIQKADIETELKMMSKRTSSDGKEIVYEEAIQKAISALVPWPAQMT